MAALVASWGFRRSREKVRRSRFGRVADFTASTAWFAAFAMLVVAYYQVLQAQQWLWYYCPVVIYLIFVLVLVVADFVEGAVLEAPAEASPTRAVLTVSAILLLPLLAAGVYEGRQMADPHGYSIAIADRDAGQWIAANTPKGTVLGSWDAGVIGYYSQRHVINLDGVANSYAYYQAARDGQVGRFLADRDIAGFVNLGTPQRGQDPSVAAFVRVHARCERGVASDVGPGVAVHVFGFDDWIGGLGIGGAAAGGLPVPVACRAQPAQPVSREHRPAR